MKWTRFIPLAALVLINGALIFEQTRQREHLRADSNSLTRQADDLNKLSLEVIKRSEALTWQSAELDKKTAQLKKLISRARKSPQCIQLIIPLPMPAPAPEPAKQEPRT
jgi:peptidoglycan hydrolase CwlO-like protein